MLDIWGRSHYYEYRNQTLEWCPSDSKESFDQHMADNDSKALLEQNGWVDKKIEYKFNEHGYRCDSWDNDIGCRVLFAGCSQTMGIGLSLDVLWASRVAEYLKVPYHNIACGGADWQHVTQRLTHWIPKLRPMVVILKELTPLIDIVDDNNSEWYKWSMTQIIEQLCIKYHIKLIRVPTGRLNYDADYKTDLARDLNHFGKQEQDYTVESVKEAFDEA